jgi:hypothetical protein
MLTLSVRPFQTPPTPLDLGLAAELAFGADLAGDARHLAGKRVQLMTMVLIVGLQLQTSPRTSTVIFFERSPLATRW